MSFSTDFSAASAHFGHGDGVGEENALDAAAGSLLDSFPSAPSAEFGPANNLDTSGRANNLNLCGTDEDLSRWADFDSVPPFAEAAAFNNGASSSKDFNPFHAF